MGKILLQFIRFYRRITNRKYGWHGSYASWQDALQQCTGYDHDAILQKILSSTLKVKNGEAVYERDGMLFDHIEYSWPLLANLLSVAQKNNGKLSVIDFGGSLGSTWFQNRNYFKNLSLVKWAVVEQGNYVTAGKEKIAGSGLDFFYSIDEAIAVNDKPDVLLLSCCLPYLQEPYSFLQNIQQYKIDVVIVENTYFNTSNTDRLTIQKVPPVYYDASYPAWFLHYEKVKAAFTSQYNISVEYQNEQFLYLDGERVSYQGFVAIKK